MASNISVSVDVQVLGGPKASYALLEPVDAYDVVEAVIPKSAAGKEIAVVPGVAGQIRILCITSDRYKDIKYKPKDGTGAGRELTLDAPHLFIGDSLLDKVPNSLVFSNASATTDANIRILVGRKV